MSELREYLCIEAKTIEYKDSHGYRFTSATKSAPEACMESVYLKSEADKVIENRDAEIARLKDSIGKLLKVKNEQVMDEVLQKCLIYGEGFVPVEHAMRLVTELRHANYKRCLAMAKWCRTSERYEESISAFRYRDWYCKWYKRWLELAEKFKEVK